ncbi:hypothetical protein AMJ85_07450, partial [candidate division BRC1 bacterium SM23_51]
MQRVLIVVAIIAILALIAVPNFLEAQLRAKVSRIQTDMRTIKTAMEAYFVDHNSYCCDDANSTCAQPGWNESYFPLGYPQLTTPVAYLTGGYYRDI